MCLGASVKAGELDCCLCAIYMKPEAQLFSNGSLPFFAQSAVLTNLVDGLLESVWRKVV